MEDADAPAFLRRTKTKTKTKTLRARASSPSAPAKPLSIETDEPVGDTDDAYDSPTTLVTKLKSKHKARAKPKARLSFGGDEEVSRTFS